METKDTKQANKGRVYFSTRSYPTFGRSAYNDASPPKTVIASPYYWWFKYLQLNSDYIATCAANGVGACAELYEDFGDIREVEFKAWWQAHVHLFAEPRTSYHMYIANSSKDIAQFDSELVLNLVVPLTWTRRTLKRRFAELVLSKIEKGTRGVSVDKSEAKYKLSGKWHIEALKNSYKVYVMRNEFNEGNEFTSAISATEKRKTMRYELTWADLAIKAMLPNAAHLKVGIKGNKYSDERKIITIIAQRYYKRAQAFIAAAATTSFPQATKIIEKTD